MCDQPYNTSPIPSKEEQRRAMPKDNRSYLWNNTLSRPLMSYCIKLALSPRAFPTAAALEDSPATMEDKADMRFCWTSH